MSAEILDEVLATGSYQPKTKEQEVATVEREGFTRLKNLEIEDLLTDPMRNAHKIMQLSNYYINRVSMLRSAYNLYHSFAISPIEIEGGKDENKQVIEQFNRNNRIEFVIKNIVSDLLKNGNSFHSVIDGSVYQLPADKVTVEYYQNHLNPVGTLEANDISFIPPALKRSVLGEYTLPAATYSASIHRSSIDRYGLPFFVAAIEPIQQLEGLNFLVKDQIAKNIDELLLVTLGSDARPPSTTQLKQLSQKVKAFQGASKIVGNHTLNIQRLESKSDVLTNSNMFKQPTQLLLSALQVPLSYLGINENNSSSNVTLSIVRQNIQMLRNEVKTILDAIYYDLAIENGLNPNDNGKIVYTSLADVRDEKQNFEMLTSLFHDGLISSETYLKSTMELNLENEQKKIQEEAKYNIEPRLISNVLSTKNSRPKKEEGEQTNE